MIVPNYVPDPIEIPGNVADAPYRFRVQFIRRVTLIHLAMCMIVAGAATLPLPAVGLSVTVFLLATVLVLLDVWRIVARSGEREAQVSAWFLPVVLASATWVAAEATRNGYPAWALLPGVAAAGIYAVIAGRDFSFVGSFLLCWIGSSIAIAALVPQLGLSRRDANWALAANTVYLFYFQYDLSSILSRRRQGEEWAAVVDLYRDVFNIFGYLVRCVRHWKKHRIWEIVR